MKKYKFSIRCYFQNSNNYTHHLQSMELTDIRKWIEAYRFTHPNLESITFKIYLTDRKENENEISE